MVDDSFLSSIAEPAPKRFRTGTHRLVSPGETLARLHRFLPIAGITRVANVTGLDRVGVPVVMVCRPNARCIAVDQGKGLDLAAAKASGLMESLESFHAEHMCQPLKLNSYEELRYTHCVVEVESLPQVEGSRFHPHLPLLWIEGVDLLRSERVWIPYEMVHLNRTLPRLPGSGCFRSTSTGLAAGNHLLEALSHAISEAVERDAMTLWRLRPEADRQATRIDLETVRDPACRDVLARIAAAGLAAAVWDATSDIGVPTFLCQILERGTAAVPYDFAEGTGAHPASEIALLRALTEALQARLTLIAGSRDDLRRHDYVPPGPAVLARRREAVLAGPAERSFRAVASWESETFREEVDRLLDRLRAAGLDRVVVVDLRRLEFGIPVVRVMIPGLEDGEHLANYRPGPRALRAYRAAA